MKYLLSILLLGSLSAKAQFFGGKYPGASAAINDTINVNFWDSVRSAGQYINAAWNNFAPVEPSTGLTSAALKKTTGVTTAVHVTIAGLNDYANSTAGYGTGNTIGYPQTTFLECAYGTTGTITLTFSGIPAGHNVVFSALSTTNNTGSGTTLNQTFTSGSWTSGTPPGTPINAYLNTTIPIVSTTLTPSSGSVIITITGTFAIIAAASLVILN